MEICLHIGAHRTGTTTFQQFMYNNDRVLRDHGVRFWGPKQTRDGLFAGLIKDPVFLSDADEKLGNRSIGRIKIEASRARADRVKHLVISEENMIGTMAENFRSSMLYGQAGERMARFTPAFAESPLRIGIAIRSYERHWASALSFRIRTGMSVPDQESLDMMVTQPRRWQHLIIDVAEALPQAQIMVWPFEAWGSQPESQLAAITARPVPMGVRAIHPWCNASRGPQELAQCLSDRGDHTGADNMRKYGERYMPFDTDHISKLKQDYSADIAWLSSGADGLATYLGPTGETFGGQTDMRGHRDERGEERLVGTG